MYYTLHKAFYFGGGVGIDSHSFNKVPLTVMQGVTSRSLLIIVKCVTTILYLKSEIPLYYTNFPILLCGCFN